MHHIYTKKFNIPNRICIITGGGGLLARRHAEAVIEGNGIPVLLDIIPQGMEYIRQTLHDEYGKDINIEIFTTDITNRLELIKIRDTLMKKYGHIDVLINNAANNPKMEGGSKNFGAVKFHDFPVSLWKQDLAVGLTGAMLCSQVFGEQMEKQRNGIILNISSDYGIIAPDQRIYRKNSLSDEEQIIKPVSYSVVKHGIIGLTKYLAAYWADKGIRVNTLCPASLHNGQDEEFISKLSQLVPLGRMSESEEYVCTILYMISDAATYMTGATVIIDGGRSIL